MSEAVATGGFAFRSRGQLVRVPAFALAAPEAITLRFPALEEADDASRVLLGLDRPESGSVALFGADVAATDEDKLLALRRRVAWAPVVPAFLSTVPLRENVAIPLRDRAHPPEPQLRARVNAQLDALGAVFEERALPQQVPATVRYLCGLARALLTAPELLIVCAPPPGLRLPGQRRVRRELLAVHDTGRTSMILLASTAPDCDEDALERRVVDAEVEEEAA